MPGFKDLALELVFDAAVTSGSKFFAARLEDFTRKLKDEPVIRLFVDGTPGMGHQASSLNVLRTLTRTQDKGLGFDKIVQIWYQEQKSNETLNKIKILLPEVNWTQAQGAEGACEQGTLYGATLQVYKFSDESKPNNELIYCFTGGFDTLFLDDGKDKFTIGLNVRYLLRLQPYKWHFPDQIRTKIKIGDRPSRNEKETNLREIKWLGDGSFADRAYYIPNPRMEVEDWERYTQDLPSKDPVDKTRAASLKWLIENARTKTFDLYAITGFRHWPDMKDTAIALTTPDKVADALLNLLCGVLASQWDEVGQTQRPGAKPVVVVNLDRFEFQKEGYPSFSYLRGILKGGPSKVEAGLEERLVKESAMTGEHMQLSPDVREYQQRKKRREGYFQKLRAIKNDGTVDRLELRSIETLSLDELQNLIKDWLVKLPDRVLFLQVGGVPPEIFNYTFSEAIVTAFEGLSTANLALNLGRAYLHVMRPIAQEALHDYPTYNNYPTVFFGLQGNEGAPARFRAAANQINQSLSMWPKENDQSAPAQLGRFIRIYLKQREQSRGELFDYLKSIQDFYTKERNDKLKMGINYLSFVMEEPIPARKALAQRAGRLVTLYDEIRSEIESTQKMSLWPGLFAKLEQLGEFYAALLKELGTELILDQAQVSKTTQDDEIVAVQLTGETAALGPNMFVVFEFTAQQEKIESSANFTLDTAWSPNGIPWIRLSEPFIQLDVAEGGLPVVGAVGGKVSDLSLSFSFPIVEGQWLFKGDFGDSGPGLHTIYDLFGGVNLLSSLPESITTLGGIKLSYMEALYDSSTEHPSLQYISAMAVASEPLPLPLLPQQAALEDLTLTLTVSSPGNVSARQLSADVSGMFRLNKRDDGPVIAVAASAPQLIFQGQLVSGEIGIEDLINLFVPQLQLDWPQAPKITAFSFSYDYQNSSYDVSCDLGIHWPVEIQGKTIFNIEEMGLWTSNTRTILNGSVTILPDDPKVALALIATAEYLDDDKGLRFEARQTGGALPLGALVLKYLGWEGAPDYAIDGLSLTVETKTRAYTITGKTKDPWPLPFIPDFALSASVELGRSETGAYQGSLSAQFDWHSIDILLRYDFDTESKYQGYSISWAGVTGLLTQDEKKTWSAKLTLSGYSLGGLVETFISWATRTKFGLAAPWNLLNDHSLDSFELTFNLTTKDVMLGYELPTEINLGLAKITKLNLTYQAQPGEGQRKKVGIELEGAFFWEIDPKHGNRNKLAWDPTKPEETPAPPGGGNKYLDLRLLALGQHVSICSEKPFASVQDAIDKMRNLAVPSSEDIGVLGECTQANEGQPYFNPDSAWLIAADFGILRIDEKDKGGEKPMTLAKGVELMPRATAEAATGPKYVLQMSIIFNDPNLYGLRVALAGEQAKIFAGLDFQIIYQRVTDTIGVYKSAITLPEVMRELSIGAYSVTLPNFAIEVYTNGDFKVDLGFPSQLDFSRSFTIQGIVPPGIPLLGAGGLYFGKLSGATSSQVPVATAPGQFNPVMVFGFGMEVGVGKRIEKGVLRAGFSITVFGIIEGVIATWNPAKSGATSGNAKNQLQGEYYFWLQGTAGIIGKLFGAVDFAIIKAEVNVELKIYAQITFESYANIPVSVVAEVDIAVALKIDLGIFSIKIHFSFHARIKETFTIANPDSNKTPPWLEKPTDATGLLARHQTRLSYARIPALFAAEEPFHLVWDNYQAAPDPTELTGYFVPVLSAIADTGKDQQACYVVMLFMETVAPPAQAIGSRSNNGVDTSFESLCKQILRWVIAAAQKAPEQIAPDETINKYTRDWIDGYAVPKSLLEQILQCLSDPSNPVPVSAEAASAFMQRQFSLKVSLPDKDVDTTVFAMPPELTLEVPSYNNSQALKYRFAEFNELSPSYIADLRSYFDELAVQLEREMEEQAQRMLRANIQTTTGPSLATFCFGDYFLLLLRQMVQGALDGLRDFKYPIGLVKDTQQKKDETVQAIVGWVNDNMISASESAAGRIDGELNRITAEHLFEANGKHLLNADKPLKIKSLSYQIGNEDTLSSISKRENYRNSFTIQELVTENADKRGILTPGTKLTYPERPDYKIKFGDTLTFIAKHGFGITLELSELIGKATVGKPDGNKITDSPEILVPLSRLRLPTITYTTVATNGDTLEKIAGIYGIEVSRLAASRHNINDIVDLFATTHGQDSEETLLYLDIPHLQQFRVGPLLDEIQRSKGLQHLSGMASRYSLHGLRLPTKGITPKQPSLCQQENGNLNEACGLFALTGQQFPLPPLVKDKHFNFSLVKADGPSWVVFTGTSGEDKLQVVIKDKDEMRAREVQAAAVKGIVPKLHTLGNEKPFETRRATYPLRSMIVWQNADPVELPYGSASADRQELRIWSLSEGIIELAEARSPETGIPRRPPRFTVQIGKYNEATSRMDQKQSESYGFATLLEIGINRVPPVEGSPTTGYTYELAGATERGIVLLERLLAAISESDAIVHDLNLLYAPSATDDSGSGLRSAGNSLIRMFISQVNLTTDTRPPSQSVRMLRTARGERFHKTPGCDNTAYDFIKLLWETSITRSGGYYLYYYDKGSQQGFPDRIFNDKGEATIQLLVSYKPIGNTDELVIASFMNNAITGDAVDTSNSVVFAQADPQPVQYIPGDQDNLQTIAWAHYMTPIEVAEQNSGHPLTEGTPLTVVSGTYMVSPHSTTPGGKIADIALHFGTTVDAIKKANPELGDSELSAYTAIRLPPIDNTIGKEQTFAILAAYYGCSIADLGYANASTRGLLSNAAALTLAGGPNLRVANTPPGSIAIGARREVPAEIPGDPNIAGFGELYLQHSFTMLGYRVYQNAHFKKSNLGLPIGPSESRDDIDAGDKLSEALAEKQEGEEWRYHTGLSYLSLVKKAGFRASLDLPDPVKSPYAGVGDMLQVSFEWLDIFGNVGRTPFTDPALDLKAPLNNSPLLLGYTDALIGLSAWPSVTSAYYVPKEKKELRLVLAFDPSRYDPSNSRLSKSALLEDDRPAWQKNAEMDLFVYRKIYYQLLQSENGGTGQVMLLLQSSLFQKGIVEFSSLQLEHLTTWLEEIWRFLSVRATGDAQAQAQAPETHEIAYVIEAPAQSNGLNPAQLFELTVAVQITRPISAVKDALKNTVSVFDVSTVISPLHRDKEGNPSFAKRSQLTYALEQFAQDFEQSLSAPSDYLLKIATGIDRRRAGVQGSAQRLWVIRIGMGLQGDGISYFIRNRNEPKIYSPRPILNRPRSGTRIPIWDYADNKAIDFTDKPSRMLDFTGVDMDVWAKTFVEAVDYLLSPEFISPMQLVTNMVAEQGDKPKDYLGELLTYKKSLAQSISKLVILVFADEKASMYELDAAQEAFKQQLLIRLSNAYSTSAVIQFQADVTAKMTNSDSAAPPHLYGTVLSKQGEDDQDVDVALTSAKITLKQTTEADPALLTFLMERVDTQVNNQSMLSYVPLNLWFQGSHIEHEIEALPGIEDYEASSWLTFLIQPKVNNNPNEPLQADLGAFDVPLPLRALPTPPSMSSQSGRATNPQTNQATSIDEALQWDYSIVYGEEYHQPQDETKFEVRFNVQEFFTRAIAKVDLFDTLAEFITVYPDVQKDLEEVVRTIEPSTTDMADAVAAIESFIALVKRVAHAWAAVSGSTIFSRMSNARDLGQAYKFSITESAADDALLLRLKGHPPEGIGKPTVSIEGYETEAFEENGDFCFKFKKDGTYLPASKGRAIADRRVTLPGLNILERQDAWSSAQLTRNGYLLEDGHLPERRATAENFVYQTPEVRFASPYHPILDKDEPIDIALIGSNNNRPVSRSLVNHLSALFTKLFEKTRESTVMIQIECCYEYTINEGLAPISLPIFLQPPHSFNVETDSKPPAGGCIGGSADQLPAVCDWASAINAWLQANRPSETNAVLHFDMTIFSNLTKRPMPLLSMRNLRLAMEYVTPSPLN